ncbi:MAG: PDZ domain-containing protein [Bdellovibrionales bacterium]|nr:PDZ domain-containing protein [Bdellovibrionales bacterium]
MKKSNSKNWVLGLSTIAAMTTAIAGLTGCDPVPRRTLSTDEKIADMYWIYSQFGENYAPLEFKQDRYKFSYDELKNKYLEDAKKTTTNDEFYALMMKFVAEFKDAHTSPALTNASLPDRAKVAFLGFNGIRNEDNLLVKSLLPTIASDSNYPIKIGDKITEINGKSLKDAVDSELIQYRNLGFDQANYTYHFNKLFNRVSTTNGLPKETEVTLTIVREGKKRTVIMPWVVKDVVQFQKEQEDATAKKKTAPATDQDDRAKSENYLMVSDDQKATLMKFNFFGFDGRMEMPYDMAKKITSGFIKKMTDTFVFVDSFAEWQAADAAIPAAPKEGLDKIAENRKVMDDAIYIAGSKTFPSYVAPATVVDKDGKATQEKKLVGYVYLDTFSPDGTTEAVVKEFKATLAAFKNLGVRDIIIDTINNGGGSLELGMQLAQALSPTKIDQPMMQFRLSDTWLDEFDTNARTGNDEATKEYSRRMLVELTAQKQGGQRLSKPYSAETLYRYQIEANTDIDNAFRVKLLTNEMCASMCDMFAGIIQDNKLGQIVGTRTMGAGGNVVNHQQAPNSHIDVRQTESLMVRKDGTYVENNGVNADVAIEVVKYAKNKYDAVIDKAVELIVKKTE